ncbi:MAG: S8 family serine peptidase [Anaerolineales bacterium]|nr:S8 family serine peptidase [Anaerolineales bacterium]
MNLFKNRTKKLHLSLVLLPALLIVGILVYSGQTAVSSAAEPDQPFPVVKLPPEALVMSNTFDSSIVNSVSHPKMDASLVQLTTAVSPANARELADNNGVRLKGDRAQVQIVTTPYELPETIAAVESTGGSVTKQSNDQTLLQAWVPLSELTSLAENTAVAYIRQPAQLILDDIDVTTEGLAVMNANAWHNAGFVGGGVKIAIIDSGFQGYPNLLGSELPANVTVKNFVDGESDSQVNGTTPHGTACAEIIHDTAPAAQLFLVKINTDLDLEQAINYLQGQGINVISTSIGWYNITPGDGTGFFANLVTQMRNNGTLWVTAAGNDRQTHWGGAFNDPDGNGYHNFNGLQEVNYFGPGNGDAYNINPGFPLLVFVRWDDWIQINQDYALILVRWNGSSWQAVGGSDNDQSGGVGQKPTEAAGVFTSGSAAPYGFVIQRIGSNRNVNLEIFTPNFPRLDELVTARSLSNLADSPNAVTVGALNVAWPYAQESYSAEGRTNGPGGTANGGALKPDITGYARVSTSSYGTGGFAGTSAATPHVAGAAALIKDAYPGYMPTAIETTLFDKAIDMGTAGVDTKFGYGRLFLGDPPTSPNPGDNAVFLPLIN